MTLQKKAVRREKESTAAAMVQSGLSEEWWNEPMECDYRLRNMCDTTEDGKTV